MSNTMKNKVIVCGAAALREDVQPACRYPENGLMPEEQVEWVKSTVQAWAYDGVPFVVATTSPYVLKALEVWMDEYECGEDVVYVGPDGEEAESTQEIFRVLSSTFSKLMHGERYGSAAVK